MNDSDNWRLRGKCANLSLAKSDAIFFPPPGGKSKPAIKFCADCPVISQCLDLALAPGTIGFWAGTSEQDRKAIRKFKTIIHEPIISMLPEPIRRGRKVRSVRMVYPEKTLDLVEGPDSLDESRMLGN